MATIEIGVEVKISAKAMIKQIDRVTGDLMKQVSQFKHRSGSCAPLCIGVVGINAAQVTTGYEGDRSYRTDGTKNRHPYQERGPVAREGLQREACDQFIENINRKK